jgi:hypothetical protein
LLTRPFSALSSWDPITETVTVSICPASAVDSVTAKSFSTITSYSTLTNYVTVIPSQSVVGPASSSDDVLPTGSGYSYIVHDGTTSWINGASPTGSFSETIQVTVFPSPSGDSEVTITQTTVVTITPPAVTSFMAQSTDALADSADGDPATSAVTSYSTKSVISVLTVYLSSRSSKSAALMTSSHSVHTVTGPPTSTTVTVELAGTSESVCSVSYVDVTTDLTSTVFSTATPSAGFTSAMNSVGNLSSLVWAASAWNATRTGSMHKPSGSGAVIALTGSLVSSVSDGHAAQKTATAMSPIATSSAYRHGKNASSILASATFYVPFMPVPAISMSESTAFSRTSSTLTKMYTNTTSTMPTPAMCGEHGKFTLTVSTRLLLHKPTLTPTCSGTMSLVSYLPSPSPKPAKLHLSPTRTTTCTSRMALSTLHLHLCPSCPFHLLVSSCSWPMRPTTTTREDNSLERLVLADAEALAHSGSMPTVCILDATILLPTNASCRSRALFTMRRPSRKWQHSNRLCLFSHACCPTTASFTRSTLTRQ